MSRRRTIFYVVIAIAIVSIVLYLFLVPQGSSVYVLVEVKEDSLNISQCALKKLFLISLLSSEENVTRGDRRIVLRVFYNQTELLSSERYDIGTGNCVLRSSRLPSNITLNSELLIRVQLYSAINEMITQTETTLVYK